MWCPACDAEYQPSYIRCPDCTVSLTPDPAPGRDAWLAEHDSRPPPTPLLIGLGPRRRGAVATAVAGLVSLTCAVSLFEGAVLFISICAFGECIGPENGPLGTMLLLGGFEGFIVGCWLASRIAGASYPLMRAVVALSTGLAVGAWGLVNAPANTPDLVVWTVALIVVVAIVAPPRSPLWVAGAGAAVLLAAEFPEPWPRTMLLSVSALSVGAALRVGRPAAR